MQARSCHAMAKQFAGTVRPFPGGKNLFTWVSFVRIHLGPTAGPGEAIFRGKAFRPCEGAQLPRAGKATRCPSDCVYIEGDPVSMGVFRPIRPHCVGSPLPTGRKPKDPGPKLLINGFWSTAAFSFALRSCHGRTKPVLANVTRQASRARAVPSVSSTRVRLQLAADSAGRSRAV